MHGPLDDPLTALLGASALAEHMRAVDWSRTSIGPVERWPPHIRAAVAIALRAPMPVVLLLGPDGVMIYNDHYAPIAGGRHPGCLGVPVCEAWPEIAAFNSNVLSVVGDGGTLSLEDQELTVRRNGVDERIWITVDYSPIPDERGRPVGVYATVRETTDTVRMRRDAASERERLARIFEQAPGFMAMLGGPEHVFEFANAAFRRLIGQRDVLGRTVRDALPDLAGQGFFELLDRVFETGEPFIGQGLEVFLEPSPGEAAEQRTLDFIYQPLHDAHGRRVGIFVEGTDISGRVAAEEALRDSEGRFRVFADTLPNHMWSTRPDGRMDWFNVPMREYFDIGPEIFANRAWQQLIHPEDRAAVARLWRESLVTEARYEVEARLRQVDGIWRWHLIRAVPLRDAKGAIARWIGTNTDVDDSRRAAENLRDSETRLRLSQEVAGIASLEVDIATGQVIGSDTLWALWGLEPRTSIDAATLEALVIPEDARIRSSSASRLDGSAERKVEYRIRRADTGEPRWIARHVEFQRDKQGRPLKMFGVMRDITESKEAEMRQRLLTHELAHRIKNILATVLAIASQTLKTTEIATARELLTQRLQALGAAHDILNRANWTAAPIREVLETALAPFRSDRIVIDGPEVAIGPKRALSLTLAVNELATNALKYGALSESDAGVVRVRWWRKSDAEAGDVLVWTWEESGGPAVEPPRRHGFGRMLLERVLVGDFAGDVTIDFSPAGVTCTLVAPWDALSESRD